MGTLLPLLAALITVLARDRGDAAARARRRLKNRAGSG